MNLLTAVTSSVRVDESYDDMFRLIIGDQIYVMSRETRRLDVDVAMQISSEDRKKVLTHLAKRGKIRVTVELIEEE